MRSVLVMLGLFAACAVCGDVCDAEETKKAPITAEEAVMDDKPAPKLRHLDVGSAGEPDSAAQKPMEQWESYDQNTGLPNVTQSDSTYELE